MSSEPSPQKQVLKEIQDFIATLPPTQQEAIKERVAMLRPQVHGPDAANWRLALTLVGAELAAED